MERFSFTFGDPYSLGVGNYRQRDLGLISLAKDGKRLDRSIIFMIEVMQSSSP